MKIGSLDLGDKPVFLAPMEDVSDAPFRRLCKEYGAALVYTEFIAADALIRAVPSTLKKMRLSAQERPVAIQIYGRDVPSARGRPHCLQHGAGYIGSQLWVPR